MKDPRPDRVRNAEDTILELHAENERLRAALQRIVNEAESDDGLTAWDGSEIARAALQYQQTRGDKT